MADPDELIERIQRLPDHQQEMVKNLVDGLTQSNDAGRRDQCAGWLGCLEHLGVEITEEDIAEARREMWGRFPRFRTCRTA